MTAPAPRFVTVLDQHPFVMAGARALFVTLRHALGPEWLPLYAVCPAGSAKAVEAVCEGLPIELLVVPWEAPPDDPYYTKTLLIDTADRWLPTGGHALYLDYDHIAQGPVELPALEPGEVMLGSEPVRRKRKTEEDVRYSYFPDAFATSLIWASTESWRRVLRCWRPAYAAVAHEDLRHREEIAFRVAMTEAGLTARAAPLPVEGGFFSGSAAGALFHYGGEDPAARAAKAMLLAAAQGDLRRAGTVARTLQHTRFAPVLAALYAALLGAPAGSLRPPPGSFFPAAGSIWPTRG